MVGHLSRHDVNYFAFEVNRGGLCQKHRDVVAPHDTPEGRGDVARVEHRGRDLVEQRLKQVVIAAVEEGGPARPIPVASWRPPYLQNLPPKMTTCGWVCPFSFTAMASVLASKFSSAQAELEHLVRRIDELETQFETRVFGQIVEVAFVRPREHDGDNPCAFGG